jgi:hypothetical protein
MCIHHRHPFGIKIYASYAVGDPLPTKNDRVENDRQHLNKAKKGLIAAAMCTVARMVCN